MSPSSSPSDPFAFLVATGAVAELTSARSWVAAVLQAEAALAAAQADLGVITAAGAEQVAAACDVDRFDVDAVIDGAAPGGNLLLAMLPQLRAAAPDVHRDATSQDIVDAATAVIVRRCAAALTATLAEAQATVERLASAHGTAPMIARTLGQHAVPTTFATVTGRWRDGLGAAVAAAQRTARPPVWLGGPSGDGSSFGEQRARILQAFAERLDVAVALGSTHAERSWVAETAGAWGTAAAACAKVALDVVVLAQDEVGEVVELADGAGGSSSMAHKHNPIAAISARAARDAGARPRRHAAARRGQRRDRARRGAWHAEWPALHQLLRATGSAANWLDESLRRLHVEPARMAANLARRQEDR